jgi:NAD(P)-dependent dehydrogenase (short-subunit alcohol dehydrogenase family)
VAGRVALVTGGTHGIGAAISLGLVNNTGVTADRLMEDDRRRMGCQRRP